MEDTQTDLITSFFKALAHPSRRSIIEVLRDGERCVCHIEACLGYRQSYLSQQLMVLREAGLVDFRRDGWNIYYHVVDEDIFSVLEAVKNITGQDVEKAPTTSENCPCPHCSSIKEIC